MVKHLLCASPVLWVPMQHWEQEISEHFRLFLDQVVFIHEQFLQREVFKAVDTLECEEASGTI